MRNFPGIARTTVEHSMYETMRLAATHISPDVEVAFGFWHTLRLGFNPGELLDFILGWTTIDIFNDDLEAKTSTEQSNKELNSDDPTSAR